MTSVVVNKSDEAIRLVGQTLLDTKTLLAERFRALFTLKNLSGAVAVECIGACFSDESALLKHECAYCLGQMTNPQGASLILERLLKDTSVETIVRHEAAEALAAIGDEKSMSLLEQYSKDPSTEVAETCQIGVCRLHWLHDDDQMDDRKSVCPCLRMRGSDCLKDCKYTSIDPAPPSLATNVGKLEETLLDKNIDLFERYRAMFALRNIGDDISISALCKALHCSSSILFRHEVAYVLGQVQSPASVEHLKERLEDDKESPIVRHECADALGSVGSAECREILQRYMDPSLPPLVSESCVVAMDMWHYENSEQFQYADTLQQVQSNIKEC